MTKKYVTISIPEELYSRVKKTIEGTGFRSVTEYMVFVTRESLMGSEGDKIRGRQGTGQGGGNGSPSSHGILVKRP